MCTIISVDKFFYKNNKEAVDERIQKDGVSNSDGWSVVFLGNNSKETVMMQSLDLGSVTTAIENVPWTRMFLHSRLATTSTDGIFGCHNFTTVGNGLESNVEEGHWIVQHNGILRAPATQDYLVDSMYIAQVIRESGLEAAITYMRDIENYANVFLINPLVGEYRVVRSMTNSLYTDKYGNYSTNPIAAIKSEVPRRSSYTHYHMFLSKNSKKKQKPLYTAEEAIAVWEKEIEQQDKIMEQECNEWGSEALDYYTSSIRQFSKALHILGYLGNNCSPMPDWVFRGLTTVQQKWGRTLGISIKIQKNSR